MRPYILAENNWYNLKGARYDLAVLPWGAIEAHNFHLPYGTDVIEADYIAAESARIAHERGASLVVLPTVPYGVNTGQTDIYLDMNVSPTTQLAIIHDLVQVLDRQGLKKLLILNSHGGNNFKPLLRELGLKFPNMFLGFCNWFQATDRSKYFVEGGDHADESETSIILHISPHLVLQDRSLWGSGTAKRPRIKAFREGWAWSERPWSKITADTGVGNPIHATAEKGAAYLKDLTHQLADLFHDLAMADPEKLYEGN